MPLNRTAQGFALAGAIVLSGVLASALSGCAGAVIGGAAVGGTAAYQERGIGGVARDTELEASIVKKWFELDHALVTRVSAEVYDGRALITGAVTSRQAAADAIRLAWTVPGLRDVINEIQEVADTSVVDTARDTWISTRLRTALTFDEKIYAINYAIETVNGVVYLIGIAQNQDEIARVVAHANGLEYVRKVVSHVRVKEGATATPAPGTPAPAPSPTAVPAAPVPTPAPAAAPAPRSDAVQVETLK